MAWGAEISLNERLGNEVGNPDLDVRHSGDPQNVPGAGFEDFAVVALEGLPVDPDSATPRGP